MISDKTYYSITENIDSMDSVLCLVWSNTSDYTFYGFPKEYSETYENRKELFGFILKKLLNDKKIKLRKNGEFWEDSIDEQVSRFLALFPTEEKMTEIEDYWCHIEGLSPAIAVWLPPYTF